MSGPYRGPWLLGRTDGGELAQPVQPTPEAVLAAWQRIAPVAPPATWWSVLPYTVTPPEYPKPTNPPADPQGGTP